VHRVNYVIEIVEEGYKQRDTLTSNYFLSRIKPSAVSRKFSESTSKVILQEHGNRYRLLNVCCVQMEFLYQFSSPK